MPKLLPKTMIYWVALLGFAGASAALAALVWGLLPSPPPDALNKTGKFVLAGDYSIDADAGLVTGMQGGIFSMYGSAHVPLMMPLSLLVRVPALVGADLIGLVNTRTAAKPWDYFYDWSPRYLVGVFATLIASGVLVALNSLPRRPWRLRDICGALLLIAALLLNPLSFLAIRWGHVEEILMAAFVLASALALTQKRYRLMMVLAACAFASKQPALFIFPTLLLATPRPERVRAFLWYAGTCFVTIVPFVLLDLKSFVSRNLLDAAGNTGPADYAFDLFSGLGIEGAAPLSKPLILLFAVAVPYFVWAKSGRDVLRPAQAVLLAAAVMLARCVLDPANISYYALPTAAIIGALDVLLWREGRHPVQRICSGRVPLPAAPLPVGMTLIGIYLEAITGGAATIFFDRYLHGLFSRAYLLSALPLLALLVAGALSWRPELTRTRLVVYGSCAALTGLLLVSAVLVHKPTSKREQVTPPAGLIAASPAKIAEKVEPVTAYWLGRQDLDATNYLRMSVYNSRLQKKRSELQAREFAALFDYGEIESFESVSVVVHVKAMPKEHRIIVRCFEKPKTCPKSWEPIETPIGPAMVQRSSWWVRVAAPRQEVVEVLDARSGFSPEEIVAKLQPVSTAS